MNINIGAFALGISIVIMKLEFLNQCVINKEWREKSRKQIIGPQ